MEYKILVKFPTRSRPDKFLHILSECIRLSKSEHTNYLITYDDDDSSMTSSVLDKAKSFLPGKVQTIGGVSKSKIDACNRDLDAYQDWNIIVLLSDDMVPQVEGWDSIIIENMGKYYPDTDGILFFSDGYRKRNLNTMCILGKEYYKRFGYIYCPEYLSFYCDNEFMEVGFALNKQVYFDQIIFKHQHPGNTKSPYDYLYKANQKNVSRDSMTYAKRKKNNFFLSTLE